MSSAKFKADPFVEETSFYIGAASFHKRHVAKNPLCATSVRITTGNKRINNISICVDDDLYDMKDGDYDLLIKCTLIKTNPCICKFNKSK